MARILLHAFTSFALLVYIGATVANTLILDTSTKHYNDMCKFGTCWRTYFVLPFQLGFAAAVISLIYSVSLLAHAFFIKTAFTRRAAIYQTIGATVVFILWLVNICMGWASDGLRLTPGELGIPDFGEPTTTTMYGNTYESLNWTTDLKPDPSVPEPKVGQYRFLVAYWDVMRPYINNFKHKGLQDTEDWVHAKQGMAVLVLNDLAFVVSFFALVFAVMRLWSALKVRKMPVTKDVSSARHSSV